MYVDELVRREAIFRIFKDLRLPVGGHLYLKTLEAQWAKTGLRQRDLVDGLEEMAARGLVGLEHDSDEQDLLIEMTGEAVTTGRGGLFKDAVGTTSAAMTLRKARRREHPAPGAPRVSEDDLPPDEDRRIKPVTGESDA